MSVTTSNLTEGQDSWSATIVATLPNEFQLGFEFEQSAIVGNGSQFENAATNLAAASSQVFDVRRLLAMGSLRHYGVPGDPFARELIRWAGLLDCRHDGRLLIQAVNNAGRLAEFSAGLGEAVALDLAVRITNIPFALWERILLNPTFNRHINPTKKSIDIAFHSS